MSSKQEPLHTAETVIALLGETVLAVHGRRDATFSRVAPLDAAGADAITFCKYSGPDAIRRLAGCQAAVVLCGPIESVPSGLTVIVTADPRNSFVQVVAALFAPARRRGIHPTAVIDPDAVIDPTVYVGPNAVIGRCRIGDATEIHANVTVYDGTRIGRNVTVFSGTVIGADGFGYERRVDGGMEKFIHKGGVVIEDDVEIGSNTSIDRGTLGDTILRRGAKVDNQVHIAHNCDVGEDAVVIAQSMIGGSVKIGARAWIAPSVVVMNGIAIGADSVCGLGSIVTKSVNDGETVMGNPARPVVEAKALLAAMKQLIAK